MISRLRINPILHSILEEKPDVFVYLESQIYKKIASVIPHYSLHIHIAKRATNRRGIAIFYKSEHTHNFSIDFTSNKYDIVWARFENQNPNNAQRHFYILCFFYAPGDSHSDTIRSDFFDEMRMGFDRYPKGTNIFLMGDSNARLGTYSQDMNIKAKYVSNKNKPLFLGFLEYTGMTYLNNLFARGVPTYEITGKRQSIIDVGLTNCATLVKSFKIIPKTLGVNPQTCHKAIKMDFLYNMGVPAFSKNRDKNLESTNKFNYCTYDALTKIKIRVSRKINQLLHLRPDTDTVYSYRILRRIYYSAKQRF